MDLRKRRDQGEGEDRTRPAESSTSTSVWPDAPGNEPRTDPGPASATVVDPPPWPDHDRSDPSERDTLAGQTVSTRDHDRGGDRDHDRDHDRDRDGVDDRDEPSAPTRHEVVEEVVVTRWSIADLVVTLIGAALALAGAVGLIRAEVDGSWFEPVVGVAGADHTALLAAAELGAGVLIALAGIARRRVIATILGVALAIGAAVAAIETADVARELAIEDWWAWTLCAAGVVVVLSALVPRKGRIRRVVEDA